VVMEVGDKTAPVPVADPAKFEFFKKVLLK
jgi:hypothetical protein